MPLASALARKWSRRTSSPHEEAEADAFVGLVRAEAKYDPERGTKFTSYAYPWIGHEIVHGHRRRTGYRNDSKHTPPKMVSIDDQACCVDLHSRLPSPQEHAERADLWRHVDQLPGRQRIAVRLHYQWGLSQSEIAGLVGVSQMQVSRDLAKARASLADLLAA